MGYPGGGSKPSQEVEDSEREAMHTFYIVARLPEWITKTDKNTKS